jgi:hypothetical protein
VQDVPQRRKHWRAIYGLLVHCCVYIVEKTIAYVDGFACRCSHGLPAVCFLRDTALHVVVSVKWVEGAQDCPPSAQMLVTVPDEATDISTSLVRISNGPCL